MPQRSSLPQRQLPPALAERYDKRLAILVPFRDREQHLAAFIPHILAYFERDKLDRFIPYSIHIIEQLGSDPFNKGMLLNAGFLTVREQCDYVCLHDVDYLPVWADYSWPDRPTRLIWHGTVLREDYQRYFGGVLLFRNEHFVRVNGFSNSYRGWGYEDEDLGLRCRLAFSDFDRRDGTFSSLPHPHNGFGPDGALTQAAARNRETLRARLAHPREAFAREGLSSVRYRVDEVLNLNATPSPHILHYRVALGD